MDEIDHGVDNFCISSVIKNSGSPFLFAFELVTSSAASAIFFEGIKSMCVMEDTSHSEVAISQVTFASIFKKSEPYLTLIQNEAKLPLIHDHHFVRMQLVEAIMLYELFQYRDQASTPRDHY